MVSKSLIHKKIYEKIEAKEDLPEMGVDQIAQILIENPKGIPNCENFELTSLTFSTFSILSSPEYNHKTHLNL